MVSIRINVKPARIRIDIAFQNPVVYFGRMTPPMDTPLADFHPVVRAWFTQAYGEPSPPQQLGWPSIASGRHTLILAPTGSGKTLAAFLWAINHLVEQHLAEKLTAGVRILYISPLKALNNDIHRNLEQPLRGIREEAHRSGLKIPGITTAVRTGDTPQSRRTAMLKHPPDILITTPESLYLMLTSKQARKMFATVQYVIVDEIHSLCGNKRGVHLSLSLERLAALAGQEFIRIGLSATQRPLDHIAGFLGGLSREGRKPTQRNVSIIDAGRKKDMDLEVICAPQDFSLLPQQSVWPLIFDELIELIKSHKTTLIFVNNRRLAERIAARLNELIIGTSSIHNPESAIQSTTNLYAVPRPTDWAKNGKPEDLVRAYHGSMSRHAREGMEAELKAGNIRALVATSSLELGIDIGSIDLVVQIQSPKGVARGLQRVGRSGHLVSATSKGRIFPSHREDLVESAVVAKAMMNHEVEHTSIPQDCLDVLAQQIVAMISVDEWDVDELYDLIRQSYCYRNLSRKLYTGVLQMLAGRYTDETFRELRARISWDRVNNKLRPLPGTSRLAIMGGGTITDRGYYGVYLEDGKTKVGEVDEEFVYESRAGDTFLLGSTVWRMLEIDTNRITVAPAPGEAARMPFWRGEGIGRSIELGKRVGEFRREMSSRMDSPQCLVWLQHEFPIDTRAAWNIQEYFRRQRDATGVIPHDTMIVVEGFRDEIGDPRIVVHSAFGRKVNGLLGLLLVNRLHTSAGLEPQMLYNDDGILLRCSDMDQLPLDLLDGISPGETESLVLDGLLSSPLFGGQFRQNAVRALLMPGAVPGRRTPLWLQRLRAGDLLQIARQFDDFPIVIETVREVLHDILDFDQFKALLRNIELGVVQTTTVHTEVPSPFAASLLLDFIAVYMYEWDQPKADTLSTYLSINREILSEVIDLDSAAAMIRPDAIQKVEQQLQHTAEGFQARSPEELLEILIRVGDLSEEEILERITGHNRGLLEELENDGRARRVSFSTGQRWIAGEEYDLYERLDSDRHRTHVIRRYLQTHGPVTSQHLAGRYDLDVARVEQLFEEFARTGTVTRGRFSNSVAPEWCYRPNLERIHRQTITILRKEVQPSSLAEFTQFLMHWQHVRPESRESGVEGLATILGQLQAIPLPQEIWERDILRSRVRDFSSKLLSSPSLSGSVVWTGTGAGRTHIILRGQGGAFLSPPQESVLKNLGEPARRVVSYLEHHGASFFPDVRNGTGLSLDALNRGVADLFWKGLITNDVFEELQKVKRPGRTSDDTPIEPIELLDPRHNPRRLHMMRSVRRAIKQVPGWSGRWSLVHVPGVMGPELLMDEQASHQAMQLLTRYGIVAREFHKREELLPWATIALSLQRMELRGEIRRGYFVEGLSGMQYALPRAVEELRRVKSRNTNEELPILLNTCDPANPYGRGIELSISQSRQEALKINRLAGNLIAFRNGTPILLIENYGTRLWTLAESNEEAIRSSLSALVAMIRLPERIRPFREIAVEYCNGSRPAGGPFEPLLKTLGFFRDKNQTMRCDGY